MVDISFYKDVQDKQSKPLLDSLGYVYRDLSDGELFKFGLSYERSLTLDLVPRNYMADIFDNHIGELLAGAMIAAQQMSAEIDGEVPASGKIAGPIPIRASYLGIGKDWEDTSPYTTGSAQNWIHSGTTFLGGTAGNAIRIGTNAVHVIIAIASYHPSPKIETFQNTLDGKLKGTIYTKWAQQILNQTESTRIKELDSAIILKKNSTLKSQLFISAAMGASVADTPYLLGVSYLAEAQARILDPATLAGTTNDTILTT